MDTFEFSEAAVVLADSKPATRKLTRDALFDFGFRRFDLVGDESSVRERIGAASTDILICEAGLPGNATASLFTDIRHGDLGTDPFLPLVATVLNPEVEVVNEIVNAGADHILTLPMSIGKFRKAIDAIVGARKPFIVTSEYVGSDRRGGTRTGVEEIPVTAVPNSLRHKATGDDDGLDRGEALRDMQEQRIKRYVNKVVVTAEMISSSASPDGNGAAGQNNLRQKLEELCRATSDLNHRITGTRFRHQSELCKSLGEVAERMRSADQPPKKDIELSQQLALAVQVAVDSADESAVAAALDISSIVRQEAQ